MRTNVKIIFDVVSEWYTIGNRVRGIYRAIDTGHYQYRAAIAPVYRQAISVSLYAALFGPCSYGHYYGIGAGPEISDLSCTVVGGRDLLHPEEQHQYDNQKGK
jgi:hypothetical protein